MFAPRSTAAATTALALAAVLAAAPEPARAATVDRATMLLDTSYVLRASLDYAAGTISARERISLRNRSGSAISKVHLSVIPRAFGELTSIGRFTVDGQPVTAAWTTNASLELQLGRVVEPGESAIVRLAFAVQASGVIGTSLEGRLSKANGIMQVSNWFPIVSDGHPVRYPGDAQYTRTARRIRLDLTTDSTSVKIAAPGRRLLLDGRRHVYEIEHARDFAFGASPYYRALFDGAAGVTVAVYYTSGDGASAMASAKSALRTFEAAYGQYQWPRFVVAQTGRETSGNEYPGIVFLGGPLFGSRKVVAHETAHQWWYGMAGNDQVRAPWLDEGLAEFSADYFYGGFGKYVSSLPVNTSIYGFPDMPAPLTSTQPDSYDQTIYHKSSRFLDGLRSRMGNSRFFGAMRDLFADNRNGVMTTREFWNTMVSFGAPKDYLRAFIAL